MKTYVFKFRYANFKQVHEKAIEAENLIEARIKFFEFIRLLNENGKSATEC